MISNIIAVSQKHLSKNNAIEFDFDIKRWKSVLKHIENESIFINRILTSNELNAKTVNLNERQNTFKKQIKSKIAVLKCFEIEVTQYDIMLRTIEYSDIAVTDSSWLEQHDFLKNRFENFCKDFNAFRLKVLKYT